MRAKIRRSLFPLVFSTLLVLSGSIFTFGATAAQTLNIPESGDIMLTNDEQPEVTDRVARVSFLKGSAKIRRSGAKDWENVTLNLPLVEGDEIATDRETRLEIQFDNYRHVRLDENSYLKLTTLRDEGIALSLSLGTMNARLTKFDKDNSFFEIDAPKTTIALQKSGSYRIDAGEDRSSEIRVSALNGGEARVYSDSSGFTLKNGRSTRIFIAGTNAGEWETADAIRFQDDFDTWTLDRDDVIARRIKDAYYDRYYDNDIYGADDLNANGDWVYTKKYGYVWRPARHAISRYADWSPYRYGHWRWMPPYGWIWVNDEPWGWATYHHGRWFYDAGYWYWSPYGYYRPRRSWWFPALVVINIIHADIFWYPAPYHYSHRQCRWQYQGHHNNNGGPRPPATGGTKPPPRLIGPPVQVGGTKPPPRLIGPPIKIDGGGRVEADDVPGSGVVTVKYDEFGTKIRNGRTPPLSVAKSVLEIRTDDDRLPQLPVGSSIKSKMDREIISDGPIIENKRSQVKVGASERMTAEPLDNELRNTKVFGGRPPKVQPEMGGSVNDSPPVKSDTRDTGAIVRNPPVKDDDSPRPVKQPPVYSPPTEPSETKTPKNDPPQRERPPVRQPPKDTPRYDPPPERKRDDPPTPRYEPPVRQSPPETPRYNPPTPKSDPPPRKDPPQKSDPPPSKKPDDGKRR